MEIEMQPFKNGRPILRIRIPQVQSEEEIYTPFSDDEDSPSVVRGLLDSFLGWNKRVSTDDLLAWLATYPSILVRADEAAGIFYIRGPMEDLIAMGKHKYYDAFTLRIFDMIETIRVIRMLPTN